MTDGHPGPDELVDLALANPTGPLRGTLSQHLVACETCRRQYAEIAAAVDHIVVAAPQSEPPPGFDQRAVAAMRAGMRPPPTRPTPAAVRVRALVVMGAVVGALVGAGAAAAVLGREPAPATAAVVAADGDRVGAVAAGSVAGHDVLVVEIEDAPSGVTYGCRVVLEDGTVRTVGEWTIGAYDDAATWVVPLPGEVTAVELVAESGAVWATAVL